MMVFNPSHGSVVLRRNKCCPVCGRVIDSNFYKIPPGETRRYHLGCVSCE